MVYATVKGDDSGRVYRWICPHPWLKDVDKVERATRVTDDISFNHGTVVMWRNLLVEYKRPNK